MTKKIKDKEVESMGKMTFSKIILSIILMLICLIVIAPLLIVVSSSLRSPGNMASPLLLFREISLASFQSAFHQMNYPKQLLNSVLLTGGSVFVVVIIATMAAYPICRIKKKASRFFYFFFIAGLVIPSQMVIVPIAQVFRFLHVANTRFTPMIMFITCSLPFSVFLFTGFMKSVPVEIEEAAYIDGCDPLRRFFQVVFPLLKSAIVSVVVTQGMWIWNDYFFPMIFTSKSNQYTLPVGMIQFLGDRENPAQWNTLFAACVLCAIPLVILFVVLQKQFINGIAAGAVKG